jgi:hypothetical protein
MSVSKVPAVPDDAGVESLRDLRRVMELNANLTVASLRDADVVIANPRDAGRLLADLRRAERQLDRCITELEFETDDPPEDDEAALEWLERSGDAFDRRSAAVEEASRLAEVAYTLRRTIVLPPPRRDRQSVSCGVRPRARAPRSRRSGHRARRTVSASRDGPDLADEPRPSRVSLRAQRCNIAGRVRP